MFVAVAEHLQFTRCRSAGCHGERRKHAVQALEQYLGQPLFRRQGRLIELTDQGARLLPRIRQGLGALQDAIDEARSIQGRGPLRISMLGSFLMQWLMPRLPTFVALHPGIELRIETSVGLVDFARPKCRQRSVWVAAAGRAFTAKNSWTNGWWPSVIRHCLPSSGP